MGNERCPVPVPVPVPVDVSNTCGPDSGSFFSATLYLLLETRGSAFGLGIYQNSPWQTLLEATLSLSR